MTRLLLLMALVGVIFLLVRALRRGSRGQPTDRVPPVRPETKSGPAAEVATMVACAHCGVHLPEPEAIVAQGHHYCSEAHRRSGSTDPSRS